jgi:hypothetical protein
MSNATARALTLVAAVRPQWIGVRNARQALDLDDHVLLHAGPPLKDPTRPPLPMRNAAILSCLHEAWAHSEAEAEAMLFDGKVRLEPSYSRSVATPLVAMVSASTTLVEIGDGARRYYGFLGTGAGPQQRFGTRDTAVLSRLAFREAVLSKGFAELLDAPVDLLAIARAAIREGDDLHNRLSSGTTLLHAVLSTRKARSEAAEAALRTIAEAPLYFLNMWMPACQLMLLAAVSEASCTLVTRLSANGEVVGLQIGGRPGIWFTVPAPPVKGPFMKGAPDNPQFGPATGDSGVIDAFGLGGQGLRHSPSLMSAFHPYLPAGQLAAADGMLAGFHPILETSFGLDAATVGNSGAHPLLSTGMVSADGRGLLGRGLCVLPFEPFCAAVAHL